MPRLLTHQGKKSAGEFMLSISTVFLCKKERLPLAKTGRGAEFKQMNMHSYPMLRLKSLQPSHRKIKINFEIILSNRIRDDFSRDFSSGEKGNGFAKWLLWQPR